MLQYSDLKPHRNIYHTDLKEKGFCVFRQLTDVKDWENSFACPRVHHGRILTRIKYCIKELNYQLDWDAVVTKFRASASCDDTSSNATDAAALHRDVAIYGALEAPPVYTLIIYLDDAKVKVVPGSHDRLKMSNWDAYNISALTLKMSPGDAILIHASLLHAGIFVSNKATPRRVVQCFDVFPNARVAAEWSPRTIHLWCPNKPINNRIGQFISRFVSNPGVLSRGIIRLHVMRAATGYSINQNRLPKNISIISTEGFRTRSDVMNKFTIGNVYVIVPGIDVRDATVSENKRLRAEFYTTHRPFLVACVIATVLALIGCRVGYKVKILKLISRNQDMRERTNKENK